MMSIANARLFGILLTFAAMHVADAEQKFYLDFDSIKDAYVADPDLLFLPPADEIVDYTSSQRLSILEYLNTHFVRYGMVFLEGPKPVALADASIKLNAAAFGAGAEKVDFRNLDSSDSAEVNVISMFKFLGKAAGDWSDEDVTLATANVVGHEALHLMGMRHQDKASPLNTGLGGGLLPGDFSPTYPGPVGATQSVDTFSGLHVGGALSFETMVTPKFVSERVVPRLMIAGSGSGFFLTAETAGDNHSVDKAQDIALSGLLAPYPFRADPEDPMTPPLIDLKMAAVTGALTDAKPGGGFHSDYYIFDGVAGEYWTIEAMSYLLDGSLRYADNADVALALLAGPGAPDPFVLGSPIPYYTLSAVTDDDADAGFYGATLFDIALPYTGTYIIEVSAASPFHGGVGKDGLDGGSYELFLYRAEPIPEPTAALAMVNATLCLALGRRRRHS